MSNGLRNRQVVIAHDQLVLTERFAIKKTAPLESAVPVKREHVPVLFKIASAINTQLPEQAGGDRAVLRRSFYIQRSAIHQIQSVPITELVSLGMPAKIIVIIQNQNPGLRPVLLSIKIRCGQTADAATDNHQIVLTIAGIRTGPALSVPHGVTGLKRADMAAPQTLQGRWIGTA